MAKSRGFMANVYMTTYNTFCMILWTVILYNITHAICTKNMYEITHIYKDVEYTLLWAQTIAIMEVIHPLIGLASSYPLVVSLQLLSRLQMVWILWFKFENTQNSLFTVCCLIAWCLSEIIRYTFYITTLLNTTPYVLKWLRFSAFLVLYPIGITCEIVCIIKGLPEMYSNDPNISMFPTPMPNWYNFELPYSLLYVSIILIYIPGVYLLFNNMLSRRNKSLSYTHPTRKED